MRGGGGGRGGEERPCGPGPPPRRSVALKRSKREATKRELRRTVASYKQLNGHLSQFSGLAQHVEHRHGDSAPGDDGAPADEGAGGAGPELPAHDTGQVLQRSGAAATTAAATVAHVAPAATAAAAAAALCF